MRRIISAALSMILTCGLIAVPVNAEPAQQKQTIRILSIGNSFSVNAHTYLAQIAKAGNVELILGNLMYPGGTLKNHFDFYDQNKAEYDFYYTGHETKKATLREGLAAEQWDYVTFQQGSHDSGMWNSYNPYLATLSEVVAELAPQAERLIHQTWAYEVNSSHTSYGRYFNNQQYMYEQVADAYSKAAEQLDARIIPCGDAFQNARKTPQFNYLKGGKSLCGGDGYHASTQGCYLLGAVWYEVFTGKSILDNSFTPPSTTPAELAVLKQVAHETVQNLK